MPDPLNLKMGDLSIAGDSTSYERTPFGRQMLKHFLFDPAYKNFNHGTVFPINPMQELSSLIFPAISRIFRYLPKSY
jgi:hypothetical protein